MARVHRPDGDLRGASGSDHGNHGAADRPLRVLAVTNLFPNRGEPERGLFNLRQLVALARRCEVEVIAPVPWVPGFAGWFGAAWERRAAIPRRDVVAGIGVRYPRYPVVPKVLRWWHGPAASLALRRPMREAHAARAVDVVLATWAYPDVVAAVAVAARLRVPVVAKVHGSDVARASRSPRRRRTVAAALRQAHRVVAVSRALGADVAALGVAADRIEVVGNGVDGEAFRPIDRAAARRRLGLSPAVPHVVFVGRLEPVKGPDVLVAAAARLGGGACVTLVGDGALRRALAAAIGAAGFGERVVLAGARPHREIAEWLNAADVVCVPSRSEGAPNVALEAASCGTPVVGSRVGGIPELVGEPACGILVSPGDPGALAGALREALSRTWDRERIRASVALRTWEASADRLEALLRAAAAENGARRPRAGRARDAM